MKTNELKEREFLSSQVESKNDYLKYDIWSENLTKVYEKGKNALTAVDSINLKIESGVHGFLGPNGAGKTTTINMLIGALSITKGKAKIKGYDAGSIEAKQLIGFLPQDPQFYYDMTGFKYLEYFGKLGGLSGVKSILKSKELMEYFDLWDSRNKILKKYSGGMKQKIGLAAALIHNPEILILDEPTANLDPIGRQGIIDYIKKLSSQNISVFISSHILSEIEQMCEKVTMIEHGKIIISDTIENIKRMFSGNIFELNTNKNLEILNELKQNPNVVKCWIQKNKIESANVINIIPKDAELLSKNIPRIIADKGAILYAFKQPEMSLHEIFMEVMDKNGK